LTFEIVCNECEGTGFDNKYKWNRRACFKCFGTGKVDWIENITGKKRRNPGKLPESDARIISRWKALFDWVFCPYCNFKSKMERIDWPYNIGWKCNVCGWITWLK